MWWWIRLSGWDTCIAWTKEYDVIYNLRSKIMKQHHPTLGCPAHPAFPDHLYGKAQHPNPRITKEVWRKVGPILKSAVYRPENHIDQKSCI